MFTNEFKNEPCVDMYELNSSEIESVSGGLLGLFSLTIEGQSALDVASHWKNGILVEQVTQYQSVSSGSFSLSI